MRQLIPCGFNLTSNVYQIHNKFFLMIPKNASNTILFGTNFPSASKKISEFKSRDITVNIFIRDPITRFGAGLIESIKRSSPFISRNYVASRASVPLSGDIEQIYKNVYQELKKDSKKYILRILKLLSSSFYDPHLCPQWYFFTSIECNTIFNSQLFLLDNMENVMNSLNLSILRNYNLNSSFDTEEFVLTKNYSHTKFLKKIVKRYLKYINKFVVKFYFKINPNSSLCSPSLNTVFNFISYEEWEEAKNLISRTIKEDPEIQLAIKDLYKIDYEIYDLLKRNKNISLPKNFLVKDIHQINI